MASSLYIHCTGNSFLLLSYLLIYKVLTVVKPRMQIRNALICEYFIKLIKNKIETTIKCKYPTTSCIFPCRICRLTARWVNEKKKRTGGWTDTKLDGQPDERTSIRLGSRHSDTRGLIFISIKFVWSLYSPKLS